MTVKMVAYRDPRTFYKSSGYKKEYTEAIHLCATRSLARAVRLLAEQKQVLNGEKVVAALDLIKAILGTWSSPECKLAQYARLSEKIRDKRQHASVKDLDILRAIRLNQYDVLQTMRILTEINETPLTLKKHISEREEQLFIELWDIMENSDTSFQEIRKKINIEWLDRETFREKVFDNLAELTKNKDFSNQILLHGFYFITPIQHKFFTLLKEAGFELIFINLYDPRYPSVFESVREFISAKNGWTDDWEIDTETAGGYALGHRFASSFEGSPAETNGTQNIIKTVYEDFYEFLSDFEIQKNAGKSIYLSPAQDPLNDRIKEYHPDLFREDRQLLSYPAGQFLFHLHKMWDEQKDTLVLTDQTLMECFSSGWLIDPSTNKNAADYTDTLYQLLPFFQSCETADDWHCHTKKLASLRKQIVQPFENYEPGEEPGDRFHKMMENPFVWLSYLNVQEKETRQIISFIDHLLDIARYLFQKEEKISLNDHFKRLEAIVESGLNAAEADEKQIIEELLEKLRKADNNEKFLVQDLSDAIALYLGGKLEDNDNGLSGKDNSNLHKVFSFEDIDGKVIEAMLNKKSLHVCGLDENNLPQSSTVLPWPLTRRALERMKKNKHLSMILLREELKPQISRYLFYSFASFTEKGIVSWLKKWEGQDKLEESFYLMLLGIEPDPFSLIVTEKKPVKRTVLKRRDYEAGEGFNHYPEHMLQEFLFCPRRFFYSFLTQEHAAYRSDFQSEFLFSNLIKTLPVISNEGEEETAEAVKSLFPQWGNLKKQYLTETSRRHTFYYRKQIKYQGKRYFFIQKQNQMLLHKGNSSILDENEEAELLERWDSIFWHSQGTREEFEEKIAKDTHPMLTATPSKLCRFCPHIGQCPDAYYSMDDEQRKLQNNN